ARFAPSGALVACWGSFMPGSWFSALVSGLLSLCVAFPAAAGELDPITFQQPAKAFRPWTVWWWFGSAPGNDQIQWELEQMDAAGIGGVEIVPIYSMQFD